mmetsp:Transcript_109112/g.233181  ORF Transcript_109112/g.233181 Transcript_109112/m.233181 type:complete len:209 (-) Transcript_109112:456-1082(-)
MVGRGQRRLGLGRKPPGPVPDRPPHFATTRFARLGCFRWRARLARHGALKVGTAALGDRAHNLVGARLGLGLLRPLSAPLRVRGAGWRDHHHPGRMRRGSGRCHSCVPQGQQPDPCEDIGAELSPELDRSEAPGGTSTSAPPGDRAARRFRGGRGGEGALRGALRGPVGQQRRPGRSKGELRAVHIPEPSRESGGRGCSGRCCSAAGV